MNSERWHPLMCLGNSGNGLLEWTLPFILVVREHNLYFLKGSLPFPILQTRSKPPGAAAMNLKDLKRLRMLLDFISRVQMPLDPTLDLRL